MWRPFSCRSLFLFSLHSSSSSTTPSPYFVRPSHFSSTKTSSSKYASYFVRASHFSSSKTSSSNAPFLVGRENPKLMLWWDFDNCYLPTDIEIRNLRDAISDALHANGIIRNPYKYKAIGNVARLLRSYRGCPFNGFDLIHIANRGESRTYKLIIDDIMNWVSQNPPPAHLILISGDEVFASVLEHLRMKNYNILIANNNRAPDPLCGAATIRWHLNSILRGENLIGEHFNKSPHDTLYGHFKLSAPISEVRPASVSVSESGNARVRVWWDLDNCNLPTGINAVKIAPALNAALKANGINGPIEIIAFGDDRHLSSANQRANFWTGIDFNFIPNGEKNDVFKAMVVDLMSWVSKNPPPAHLFLISGDEDFGGVLQRLRMKNYNILLACTERAPDALCSAATITWHWNSLVTGEELIGKHFNYPIDESWYGHFKAPIEEALSTFDESTGLNTEEASN